MRPEPRCDRRVRRELLTDPARQRAGARAVATGQRSEVAGLRPRRLAPVRRVPALALALAFAFAFALALALECGRTVVSEREALGMKWRRCYLGLGLVLFAAEAVAEEARISGGGGLGRDDKLRAGLVAAVDVQAHLGFGRTVGSEIEVPNVLVHPVQSR